MADFTDFGPDGTQAPPPPRLFPDPLAGLVTADTWQQRPVSRAPRVSVPTPPAPTEDMRQAIQAAMEQERRRPRGRSRVQTPQTAQAPRPPVSPQQLWQVPQQNQAPQQPQKSGGVAAVIGCLVVLGFFVLVIINIIMSIID